MDALLRDLRFGIRMLVKRPGLSLTVIVTFGLGIGLTTTVFSIVNGVIFKGLPFERADRVVVLGSTNPARNVDFTGVGAQDFADFRDQQTVFEGLAALDVRAVNLAEGNGQPERFTGGFFDHRVFDLLRVRPILGRTFREAEDRPGADPVIVLGYELWRDRFGGSRDVLGRTLKAHGVTRTIIGVMPEGFAFPDREQLWLPLALDPSATPRGQGPQYFVVGRLKDGVSQDEAQVQMTTIAARLEREYPDADRGLGVVVQTFTQRLLGGQIFALLLTMLGAVIGVLLFVLGATVFAGVASSLFPAIQTSKTDIVGALKDEGRGTSGLRMGKFTSGLVIAEVAISCALLIASGLMIRSVVHLRTVPMPFATKNIFTARLNLPADEYADTASLVRFYDELLPRLAAIPGVEAATLSDGLPAPGNGTRVFEVEGQSYPTDDDFPLAREGIVTDGYFETFQTRVLRGRAFSRADRRESQPVAVVNQSFAQRFFPDGDPIGRRIRMGVRDTTAKWLTVVGMVPDLYMEGIGNNGRSPVGFYIPISQSGVGNNVSISLRTRGAPMSKTTDVRAAVTSLNPDLPIFNVMSMDGVIELQTWFYRVFGTLFMAFGFAALFLAAIGLYGVMSFSVTRRSHEMGVRMALGAQGEQLVWLVLKKGVVQLAIGLGIGLGLAALATSPLQFILFGVQARDPAVFGAVVATLALIGLAASFIPARRVTRVDPVIALNAE